MKRSLILMGICLLAFTSCSKDQVRENNRSRNAIGFRSAVSTRASETTTWNLEFFYVSAFENHSTSPEVFFEDVEFEKVVDHFVSMPEYYWPSDGSSLYFYAYAPDETELGCTSEYTSSDGMLFKDFAPKTSITDQVDFITATGTGSSADASEGVELEFSHQLAQIEVYATNDNEEYIYNVLGVRIGNVTSKGTFNLDNDEWTYSDVKASYEVKYSDLVPRTLPRYGTCLMETQNNNAMLIPQQLTAWNPEDAASTGSYIGVLVNIKTKSGAQVYPAVENAYDWVAVPVSTEWKAGYRYRYILNFGNGAGYVAPDLEDPSTNTTGTKIGNTIKATMIVKDWNEVDVTEKEKEDIVGTWEIYEFVHIEYVDDECTIEEDRSVCNNIEGDANYDIGALRAVSHDFYKFKISESGNEIIALDDNLNETGVKMFFTYENNYMKIPSLDGTRTVPHVDYITKDEQTGVIHARLSIDRRDLEDDRHLQYLYYTITR